MSLKRLIAVRDESRCLHCGFCEHFLACPAGTAGCIGCGACVRACPQGARRLEEVSGGVREIRFRFNGEDRTAYGPVSVRDALRQTHGAAHEHVRPGALDQGRCDTGACWSCALLIDGEPARGCVTPLREGVHIVEDRKVLDEMEPRRVVTLMRPPPHFHASIFTHGCNYNCDLCHNWTMTFSSSGQTQTPKNAVAALGLDPERDYWVGISGGEPTLNRPWLLQTVREIRKAVPDIRIQVDTNASLLSPEYIDDLVEAGVTDLSPDLKAHDVETFRNLCGVPSEHTARRFLETSWKAVRYIREKHSERVFLAVSIPYHPNVHSPEELRATARSVAEIDQNIPVTLIEYQPAFRIRNWPFIPPEQMRRAREIVESEGLSRVLVQGGSQMPRAVDPVDLMLTSEEF